MTIIAAHGMQFPHGLYQVIFVADSRVTRAPMGTRSDEAQKLIRIGPNIVLGIAGDYSSIQSLSSLQKKLMKRGLTKPIFTQNSLVIASNLAGILRDTWKSKGYKDSSFLVSIQDFSTHQIHLYVLDYPDFQVYELSGGLYIRGSDADTRSKFKQNFESKTQTMQIGSLDGFAHFLHAAMWETYGPEVGGACSGYIIDGNGIRPLGFAMKPDYGKFIVDSPNLDGTVTRTVDQKEIQTTTFDWDKIHRHLNDRK